MLYNKFFSRARHKMVMASVSLAFLASLLTTECYAMDPPEAEKTSGVASAHHLATRAGENILKKGGNAFDAIVATAATLNVVEPMMSGIGGYGTILTYKADEKTIKFLNTSGRFPQNLNGDLMRENPAKREGAWSISTPTNLNGWYMLHQKHGKLPWKDLFEDAIHHAKHGFPIPPNMAQWLKACYGNFSDEAKLIYGQDGMPLKEKDTLIQKNLVRTLAIIAEKGLEPFYHGEIANTIAKHMKEIGSFLTLEDLQNNKAEWADVIKFSYNQHDIYTAGPPATAFSALVMLGMMQEENSKDLKHNSAEYLHFLIEAAKASEKARVAYARDPEINPTPVEMDVLSTENIQKLSATLDRDKASTFLPFSSTESQNTTHFVAVDQQGNTVSATQTLGNMFGSKIMIPGTGIWMNSSMAFATFEPKGNPMDVFPGRHKLSGDCPIIIMKDDKVIAALGTPGGHTIAQNVPQIIANIIDFRMSVQEAIDAPKFAFIPESHDVRIEKLIPREIQEQLKTKGHKLEEGTIGNATGLRIFYDTEGAITSVQTGVDKRRDGHNSIRASSQ